MPPGRLDEGILVVSMRGSPLTGSGKSFTPCSRTQSANLRRVRLLLRAPLRHSRRPAAPGPCTHQRPAATRGAHIDPEDVVALRVRVREVGDAVRPDALGELHRLVLSGERLAGGAGAAGGGGLGRCVRTAARADQGDRRKGGAAGRRSVASHAAIEGSAVLPARMRFSICRRYAPARARRGSTELLGQPLDQRLAFQLHPKRHVLRNGTAPRPTRPRRRLGASRACWSTA